jgi:hypothetical protein
MNQPMLRPNKMKMTNNYFRRVWRIPLLLALFILFGLLSALLGTGVWHILAWIALAIPLAILIWKISKAFFIRPASAA